MTLDHVVERARVVVERRPPLETERLVESDLDALDVFGGPDRLEHAIRETHTEDVENGRASEEVIHTEDALLRQERGKDPVQLTRALLVVSEGLLQSEDRPVRQLPRGQGCARRCGGGGRHGEVQHERGRRRTARQLRRRAAPLREGIAGVGQ